MIKSRGTIDAYVIENNVKVYLHASLQERQTNG